MAQHRKQQRAKANANMPDAKAGQEISNRRLRTQYPITGVKKCRRMRNLAAAQAVADWKATRGQKGHGQRCPHSFRFEANERRKLLEAAAERSRLASAGGTGGGSSGESG